jgi:CDP-diacylglycerol--serine O-phosphatidyltransferase
MSIFQIVKTPDAFTLSNALFGVISIFAVHEGFIDLALILLLLAAVADGLDGYIARRYTCSELGESLDSLADVISFGVAPAVIIYSIYSTLNQLLIGALVCFYVVCGILRLARFNALAKAADFEGLPITAGCVMLVSYLLMDEKYIHVYVLFMLLIVLSLLMVSNLPYFKLRKTKNIAVGSVIFGLLIPSFFVNIEYTRFFSLILFTAMVLYVASPLIKNSGK